MARIWRDGQKRDVFIYRMITSGTIEEKIFQRQITKTSLSDQVIDTVPINQQTKFTSDELKALFQVDEDGFECCQTHDIIECRCDGSGNIPEAEEDCIENLDVEDSDEDSLQLNIFMRKPEKKSALKQHELVKWEHHKYPVAEKVLAVSNTKHQLKSIY